MKKIICDRCGKEIESSTYQNRDENTLASDIFSRINYKLTSQIGFNIRTYDLCKDCQNDLTDWLNNGREEEK